MMLDSRPGQGATFRIIMPKTANKIAKGGQPIETQDRDRTTSWPNRTMSST
jgi:hypothetical protein